jgi:hypothetical protein
MILEMEINVPTQFVIEKIKTAKAPSISRQENSGICSTCANESTCVYYQSRGQVVHFCEEYDGSGARLVIAPKKKTEVPAPVVKIEKIPVFKGLCVNCEKRETCRFDKPEEGIWHCEEYE